MSRFVFILSLSLCACTNFGVVQSGRVYRSGQLDADELKSLVKRYKIRTVINLRGPKPKKDWYVEEQQACADLGVSLKSTRWSANRLPRPNEVLDVLKHFEEGPYPVLIHCRAGADRTGLASALYRHVHLQEPIPKASDELTVLHGHLGRFGGTGDLDWFLELYQEHGQGQPLRQWVERDYPGLRARLVEE